MFLGGGLSLAVVLAEPWGVLFCVSGTELKGLSVESMPDTVTGRVVTDPCV